MSLPGFRRFLIIVSVSYNSKTVVNTDCILKKRRNKIGKKIICASFYHLNGEEENTTCSKTVTSVNLLVTFSK